MNRPRATIVIPCYNYGRFLPDAVQSCLDQQNAKVDVIIVNDGSDDQQTPAVCDSLACDRVKVIHQQNAGLPAARNTGTVATDTPLIGYLDADDWLKPWFVHDLANAMESDPEPHLVSHAYGQQEMAELGHGTWAVPAWDPILMLITNIHAPTTLVKRSAWEKVGGFNPVMRHGYEDWEFWINLIEHGFKGTRLTKPIYVWRRHSHETMIHRAVKMHDQIYQTIISLHQPLFEKHALEIIKRTNSLMRDFDVNWLDENLEAIPLRNLKQAHQTLIEQNAQQNHQLNQQIQTLQEQLTQTVAGYEAKPVIRASRKFHSLIDRLPSPLARIIKTSIHAVK